MSRKPVHIRTVNLEEGRPTVERARLRMHRELQSARKEGVLLVKLIHGYGSTGVGGTLRIELQKELRKAAEAGTIHALIPGEDWRISDPAAWELIQKFPELKADADLGRRNQGISVVVLAKAYH